ncbi:hypothetical protein OU994_20960 [Pseudoduganella sp. SL102]|uniref:hypothetical protein n=1 Tax=Pseudoduganella sp. SL102 TaxID=2995154 RepID=UPI00248C9E8C|nr:hypothetical protein [Pseudoduganella sp. SL102]WBS00770.1 hypothetical protein OU994_20960 [Pseudoduganella sp. SL102]
MSKGTSLLAIFCSEFTSKTNNLFMKKSITTLILGIATAGAFTTTAAANIAAGTSFQAPAHAQQATPTPNGPKAGPKEEVENEPGTTVMPEDPNGPVVNG